MFTYVYDPLWDELSKYFQVSSCSLPEGYKIVETEEHKQKRLERSLQETKEALSYHEAKVQQLSKSISEQEGELKSLKSG